MKISRTLPGGIVHFRNLDTQPPQVGPSFLGTAIAQPQQGLEHGSSSRNSQTFTPVPIAPLASICILLCISFLLAPCTSLVV